ncbi:MAG: hypothetical protein ACMUIE_01090 [Thermoplasmatota archaeon]
MEDDEDPMEFRKKLEKAKTFEFSDSASIERSEEVEWIEPTLDVETFDLEKVTKTIKVQGYELREPEAPAPDAEKKALQRSDPTADFKRNREALGIICPTCKGTGKCPECKGRKRVKLIFRCKKCMGTGICPDCSSDLPVPCPQCREPISKFSSTCSKCGLLLHCPVCGSQLPAMATKCMHCSTEFLCHSCSKSYPRQHSWKCIHCGYWNEQMVR